MENINNLIYDDGSEYKFEEYVRWWKENRLIFLVFAFLEVIIVTPMHELFWGCFSLNNLIIFISANLIYTLGWQIEYVIFRRTNSFSKIEQKKVFYSILIALIMIVHVFIFGFVGITILDI